MERLAPRSLAEDWDNPGLQVGDPEGEVDRILVALTPLPEVFEEAEEIGANLLLFHHPLIFRALSSVDLSSYPGDLVARAVKGNLSVYAAHTNYDAAPEGISVALAGILGLRGPLEVVVPRGALRKLVIFVPEENADKISDALTGVVGEYMATNGKDRLEIVVPAHLASRATAAAVYPYEVYPIDGYPKGCGYGRLGRLPEPLRSEELRDHVCASLGFPARLVANPSPERRIERVAVLGGSGGSFVREAAARGAEAYVTGDLDYHDALLAESLGIVAVDAGHAATELPSLEPLARRLAGLVDVPVSVSRVRR